MYKLESWGVCGGVGDSSDGDGDIIIEIFCWRT